MSKARLFLKLDRAEHNILNVTKKEMSARTYRELILTLIEGEYIDCLCNSVLIEKALRRILVNLNQLKPGYIGSGNLQGLIDEIKNITSILVVWNNNQIKPVFSAKGTVHELQIRLSDDEKSLIRSAKTATGFRTFGDLVVHLCCAYISNQFNLPMLPEFSLFNDAGKTINDEARTYNTYHIINPGKLNEALDSLYDLIRELYDSLSNSGGHNVR